MFRCIAIGSHSKYKFGICGGGQSSSSRSSEGGTEILQNVFGESTECGTKWRFGIVQNQYGDVAVKLIVEHIRFLLTFFVITFY